MFPAEIRRDIMNKVGYAFWNGIMDWSTRDIPMLPKDDMTWKAENQTELTGLCSAGGSRAEVHLDIDIYGAMTTKPINSRPKKYCA